MQVIQKNYEQVKNQVQIDYIQQLSKSNQIESFSELYIQPKLYTKKAKGWAQYLIITTLADTDQEDGYKNHMQTKFLAFWGEREWEGVSSSPGSLL